MPQIQIITFKDYDSDEGNSAIYEITLDNDANDLVNADIHQAETLGNEFFAIRSIQGEPIITGEYLIDEWDLDFLMTKAEATKLIFG
ncbi:MAG: hypothetical protein LBV07_04185 [Syntrophobacterales bacterium]|jgi:hypothetical protein|nr:hypothetical protein [Syntrophobacterales bacterium]